MIGEHTENAMNIHMYFMNWQRSVIHRKSLSV